MTDDELLNLIDEYANAKVQAALERRKDPWTSFGMGSIQRASENEAKAEENLKRIKEMIHALSKRT